VSGPSGSGKTTLGNKLKEIYENKIDELLDDHLKDYFGEQSFTYNDINEDAYQEYIDNWIDKHKKPIVFVGLNDNFVDFYPTRKNIYYNVHPQYKYYIDIDDSIIVKQKCMRFFDNLKQDMNLMNDLVSRTKRDKLY
jgi:adenylate kinase family enzyme